MLTINHFSKEENGVEKIYITLTDMWDKIIKTFCFNDIIDNSIDQSAISLCKMEKEVADFIKKEGYWIPGHYGRVVYNEEISFNAFGVWNFPNREGKYFSFKELVKNLKSSSIET